MVLCCVDAILSFRFWSDRNFSQNKQVRKSEQFFYSKLDSGICVSAILFYLRYVCMCDLL